MKIETHVVDRKQLVNQMAQALGVEAKYLGAPGFAYQVGPYVINKQAEIEVDDTDADMDLLREIVPGGILDDAEEEEIAALEISVPTEGHTVTSIMNLLHLFCSREKLLNRCVGNARNFLMNKKFIKALDDQIPESLEKFFDRQDEAGGEKVNRGLSISPEKITVAFPYTEDADTIKAYAAKSVADKIKSFLHFSVPDEGPLTDYESWMPDFMGGLAKGIEKSKSMVAKAVEGLASDMVINPRAMVTGSYVATEGDKDRSVTDNTSGSYVNGPLIQVNEMTVRSDDDIRRISQELNTMMKAGRRARGLV